MVEAVVMAWSKRSDMGSIVLPPPGPKTVRVGHGTESMSRYFGLWVHAKGATLGFWRAGKSTDKTFIEAFQSPLQAECLNRHAGRALPD